MRSNTLFGSVGGSFGLWGGGKLSLTGSLGHSSFKQSDGLMRSGEDIVTSSFAVGFSQADILDRGDTLSLALAQPLRVESGAINLSVPAARKNDGSIMRQRVRLNPQPSGREINLQATYGFTLPGGVDASLGAMHRFNANHVQGRNETIGMASFSLKF